MSRWVLISSNPHNWIYHTFISVDNKGNKMPEEKEVKKTPEIDFKEDDASGNDIDATDDEDENATDVEDDADNK